MVPRRPLTLTAAKLWLGADRFGAVVEVRRSYRLRQVHLLHVRRHHRSQQGLVTDIERHLAAYIKSLAGRAQDQVVASGSHDGSARPRSDRGTVNVLPTHGQQGPTPVASI